MKQILALFVLSFGVAAGAAAQQLTADRVPSNVRQAYQTKFPGTRKVEWKLKNDGNYEAEFRLKRAEIAAKFDTRARWLETETTIPRNDLPSGVRAAITKDFAGYRIIETQDL